MPASFGDNQIVIGNKSRVSGDNNSPDNPFASPFLPHLHRGNVVIGIGEDDSKTEAHRFCVTYWNAFGRVSDYERLATNFHSYPVTSP